MSVKIITRRSKFYNIYQPVTSLFRTSATLMPHADLRAREAHHRRSPWLESSEESTNYYLLSLLASRPIDTSSREIYLLAGPSERVYSFIHKLKITLKYMRIIRTIKNISNTLPLLRQTAIKQLIKPNILEEWKNMSPATSKEPLPTSLRSTAKNSQRFQSSTMAFRQWFISTHRFAVIVM